MVRSTRLHSACIKIPYKYYKYFQRGDWLRPDSSTWLSPDGYKYYMYIDSLPDSGYEPDYNDPNYTDAVLTKTRLEEARRHDPEGRIVIKVSHHQLPPAQIEEERFAHRTRTWIPVDDLIQPESEPSEEQKLDNELAAEMRERIMLRLAARYFAEEAKHLWPEPDPNTREGQFILEHLTSIPTIKELQEKLGYEDLYEEPKPKPRLTRKEEWARIQKQIAESKEEMKRMTQMVWTDAGDCYDPADGPPAFARLSASGFLLPPNIYISEKYRESKFLHLLPPRDSRKDVGGDLRTKVAVVEPINTQKVTVAEPPAELKEYKAYDATMAEADAEDERLRSDLEQATELRPPARWEDYDHGGEANLGAEDESRSPPRPLPPEEDLTKYGQTPYDYDEDAFMREQQSLREEQQREEERRLAEEQRRQEEERRARKQAAYAAAGITEQDASAAEQDASAAEQDASAAEQDASAAEQDASAAEQDASAAEQDASAAEPSAAEDDKEHAANGNNVEDEEDTAYNGAAREGTAAQEHDEETGDGTQDAARV